MKTAVAHARNVSPPVFLRLAGHPLRWRLLAELAHSDRQVRELTELLGRTQSLVSYHLGRLRKAQLVTMRRSSADGRDAYYSIDLVQCGQLLGGAGGALHPALRLNFPLKPPEARNSHTRVLFLCTGNSARSQMAEALIQHLAPDIESCSAGSRPKSLHPNSVRAMREWGIDLSGQRAKHMQEFLGQRFDYVITLCDQVREVCPEFPGHPETIHWSMADPAAAGSSDEETFPVFQRTAVELEMRIGFFLHVVRNGSSQEVGADGSQSG